jgi:hypothetical protein
LTVGRDPRNVPVLVIGCRVPRSGVAVGLSAVRSLDAPPRLTTDQKVEDFEQDLGDQYLGQPDSTIVRVHQRAGGARKGG